MLNEINKDALDIAELKKEIDKIKGQYVSNLRCIVALEEETRVIKSQERNDYIQLINSDVHKTKALREQDKTLTILQKDVSILKDQLITFNKVLNDVVSTVAQLKQDCLVKTEPYLIERTTGIKKLLIPLHRCPNIFALQAKAFTTTYQEHQDKGYFCERACWVISVRHLHDSQLLSLKQTLTIEDRATVRTYLSDNMQLPGNRFGDPKSFYFKTLVPAFTNIMVFREDFTGGPTLQPTLIEFYS